jgi:hypothetical protein
MTSKIKVDNINKVSDDSNIIKKCGTTTTIGSGASNPIVVDGSAITLGRCGGTVSLASGATQTGFGRSGSVNWQTTPITATFTPVDGEGYFINSGSSITANLPAGSPGAIVAFSDYARNFATYSFVITPNGSEKIGGNNDSITLTVDGQALTLVYVDSTKGWVNVQNAEDTEQGISYMSATVSGACNTLVTAPDCGNIKVATFVNPGTFCVSTAAVCAADNVVSYVVIGGGGGAGKCRSGGGGAGGYREVVSPGSPYSGSPLDGYPNVPNRVTVSATGYPITIGGGGPGSSTSPVNGTPGGSSTFDSITSAGGGAGQSDGTAPCSGQPGGSGGGGSNSNPGGTGNTPAVTPAQGKDGGNSTSGSGGGGGGGAAVAGTPGGSPAGAGGAGTPSSITGGAVTRAGGGGGGSNGSGAPGGAGGGGCGVGGGNPTGAGGNGSDNTGGGGGGVAEPGGTGGQGGSGVVIIRYRFQ